MNPPRSCLVRPLDPRYPTNRAVIIILPIAGVIAAGVAWARGIHDWHLLAAALGGAGTAFVAWALARELAPDDNPAAFVSLALAFAGFLAIPQASVLLVFLAITLVRILNRSVGIPARMVESLGIVLLAGCTTYANRNPLPAFIAAVAFALDAVLSPPLRRQWVFAAGLGLAALIALPRMAHWNAASPIGIRWRFWALAAIAAGFVGVILRTRELSCTADLTGAPLSPSRVRAGMVIGLAMAMTGWVPLSDGLARSALIWAVLLGIVLGHLGLTLLNPNPSKA